MLIAEKYLIFLGDVADAPSAKTGFGLVHWCRERCAGQWRTSFDTVNLGLPDMTPAEAVAAGARTMVIGVAPTGGEIQPAWIAAIVAALDAGLDIASGMHTRLASVPAIADAAQRTGRVLSDVRHARPACSVASGRKRSGLRLLTVGTDCAVGKKYAALCIAREMQSRGIRATFRATGQTGILISGAGVAVDAAVADFISGTAEWLSPDNDAAHWDIIEGQGSLFHPAYAGVSTGLLHGSQPDAIVVCHDPTRATIDEYPEYPLPTLEECIDLNLRLARLTNPAAQCVGISLNTSRLSDVERKMQLRTLAERMKLPCIDPITTGAGPIVERIAALFPTSSRRAGHTQSHA